MKNVILSGLLIVSSVIACKKEITGPKADALRLVLIATQVSMYGVADGAVDLTITGGTEPYTIVWSNGAVTEDVTDLEAGTYSVEVTDAENKVSTDSIIISQPRLLFRLTSRAGDSYCRWSPDGRTIAYNSEGGIWIISSSGGVGRLLIPNGRNPSWSSDGRQIAFDRKTDSRYDIWSFSLNDSSEIKVTAGDVGGYRPSWSPDGTCFVASYMDDIWLHNLDGTAPVQLTTDEEWDGAACWSPVGSTVMFTSKRSGHSELWMIDAAGGEPVRKTFLDALVLYPTWSFDGTRIVFSNLTDPVNDIYNIYTLPAAGGTPTQLINVAVYDSYPSWSPDGTKVVFSAFGSAVESGLWIVGVE